MEDKVKSTRTVYKDTYFLPDDDSGPLRARKLWGELDDFAAFADMLVQAAVASGYGGDPQDKPAVCRYIIQRGAEKGIPIEEWKKTLQNWLNKKEVGRDPKARDRVYQLCFALDMSPDQVKDFFRRAYWERVVNYRAENECVYWYCLERGLPYARGAEILGKVREARMMTRWTEDYASEPTAAIGRAVLSCPDEEALVRCLVDRTEAFTQNSTTAVAKVKKLLEDGKRLLQELCRSGKMAAYYPEDQPSTGDGYVSTERFLNFVYGVPARTYDDKGNYLRKDPLAGASGSFPLGYARKCIPSDAQLDKILAGKADYDSIRKALVLLHFASFVLGKMVAGVEDEYFYDDFLDEVNASLQESGYPELYLRNPYDWLFAYCMTRLDPLDALHEMLSPLNREEEQGN